MHRSLKMWRRYGLKNRWQHLHQMVCVNSVKPVVFAAGGLVNPELNTLAANDAVPKLPYSAALACDPVRAALLLVFGVLFLVVAYKFVEEFPKFLKIKRFRVYAFGNYEETIQKGSGKHLWLFLAYCCGGIGFAALGITMLVILYGLVHF